MSPTDFVRQPFSYRCIPDPTGSLPSNWFWLGCPHIILGLLKKNSKKHLFKNNAWTKRKNRNEPFFSRTSKNRQFVVLTSDVVAQNSRCDNVATGSKQTLKIWLSQVLRQTRHIQVGSFDCLTARPGIGDLFGEKREHSEEIYGPIFWRLHSFQFLPKINELPVPT